MIEAYTSVRVRFSETDAMGVVYHANYLPWCECARLNLIESIGMDYAKMTLEGINLPVVEAHLSYKHPARFGDTVKIKACIKEPPSVKIKIEYEITRGTLLLAIGYTIHAFVNANGIPIKPPKDVSKKLSDALAKK